VLRCQQGKGGRICATGRRSPRAALEAGWADTDLAEAFAYVGVMVYVAYFVAYADSEPDPAISPADR
jgi:hypothetical protein